MNWTLEKKLISKLRSLKAKEKKGNFNSIQKQEKIFDIKKESTLNIKGTRSTLRILLIP